MNRTLIEWVKNPDGTQGYTSNPITGCKYHTPDGLCLGGGFPCYAFKLANTRLKNRYLANSNVPVEPMSGKWAQAINDPFYPRFWEDRLIEPIQDITFAQRRRWGEQAKAKGIFVCDMGELFGDWIPPLWQERIFEVIHRCPQHRFYLLTKQPQNLIRFSPFPNNCWVGVTATGSDKMMEAWGYLGQIEAKVKYLSLEPLLEQMYMSPMYIAGLDWVIIGAQTKPYKPPEIEWVEEIVRVCDKAGVKVFLKDNLLPLFEGMGVLPWDRGNYRQELPETKGV